MRAYASQYTKRGLTSLLKLQTNTLLSNISKFFKKAVYSRLYDFLNKYKKQFGFQNSQSTNHALITITETIREALDRDEYLCEVFLDFQKAFETVNHEI